MDISIIIVNWNSKDYLQKCLASVERETHGLQYEVVVIDAGSFDGCEEMLKQHFPKVKFLQADRNIGFVRANNEAFKHAVARTLLFLNPDTEITGFAINKMYDWLHTLPQAAAVGCKLLNGDGTVQTSCIQSLPTVLNQVLDSNLFRACWRKSPLWGTAPLYRLLEEPAPVRVVSGACLMVKREAFEKVGGFSSDYFMYAEDVDLCYKIRRIGGRSFYVPDAVVIHYGGGSSDGAAGGFSSVMMRESLWRFLRKTRGSRYAGIYRLSMLVSSLVRLLLLILLFPVQQIRRRGRSWKGSVGKWWAVLCWSLFRRRLVRRYL